jgi:hypothetical protein
MTRTVLAGLFVVALAVPAMAAEKYFVVKDTVGNCSVVQGGTSAGLERIQNKDGYDSADAAGSALEEIRDDCEGVVE